MKKIYLLIKKRLSEIEYLVYSIVPNSFYPFFLSKIYKKNTGRNLNLKNPKLLTEKIQWLKLYENSDLKTNLTDKLYAKEYVIKNFPEIKTAKLYGVWEKFEDINFDDLPDSFVLKTNNLSSYADFQPSILVKNKYEFLEKDYKLAKTQVTSSLKMNFAFQSGFQLQYKNIKPLIYCEEYLSISSFSSMIEYKIFCLNGVPQYILVMMPFGNYRLTVTLYDCNWKKLPYSHSYDICIFTLKKPKNLELMLKYARIFSKDFKLLSTDFYEIDGQLYFSGFNFSPSSGFMTYYPENIDEMLGDRLTV